MISPMEVADSLEWLADIVLIGAKELQAASKDPSFLTLLDDLRSQAHMGQYYAAKIRAAVHLAIYNISGDRAEHDKTIAELEKAYRKWANQSKLEIIEQEIQMVSEKHQFGGCPDAIGMIDGELSLVDWKTSKAVYPDYMIQVAAYALLWEENYPDRPITGGYHLCRFSKTGGDFSHHYWSELEDAKQQFILFRQAYDLDKKIKARCG